MWPETAGACKACIAEERRPVADDECGNETPKELNSYLIPGLSNDVALLCLGRLPYSFSSVSKQVARLWRTAYSSCEYWELRRAEGLQAPIAICYCGLGLPFLALDTASGKACTIPQLPGSDGPKCVPAVRGYEHCGLVAVPKGVLFIQTQGFGGGAHHQGVWMYDFQSGAWRKGPTVRLNTVCWMSTLLRPDLLVVVGPKHEASGDKEWLGEIAALDGSGRSWTLESQESDEAGDQHQWQPTGIAVLDTEVVVLSNLERSLSCSGRADVFDLKGRLRRSFCNLEAPPQREHYGPICAVDGKIFGLLSSGKKHQMGAVSVGRLEFHEKRWHRIAEVPMFACSSPRASQIQHCYLQAVGKSLCVFVEGYLSLRVGFCNYKREDRRSLNILDLEILDSVSLKNPESEESSSPSEDACTWDTRPLPGRHRIQACAVVML